MTRSELADRVATGAGLSRKDAEAAVKAVFDAIEQELAGGGEVQITGFGKFSVTSRAAREGVNPRDPGGAKIAIRARKAPRFTAGAGLKSAVDGN